jgi:hypothetical protein
MGPSTWHKARSSLTSPFNHILGVGGPTGLGRPGSLPEIDAADQTRLGPGTASSLWAGRPGWLPRITSRERRGRPNQAGAWDHFLSAGRPTGLAAQVRFPRRARQTEPGHGAWDHVLGVGRPTGLGCLGSLSRGGRGRPNQAEAWDHFLIVGGPTGLVAQDHFSRPARQTKRRTRGTVQTVNARGEDSALIGGDWLQAEGHTVAGAEVRRPCQGHARG